MRIDPTFVRMLVDAPLPQDIAEMVERFSDQAAALFRPFLNAIDREPPPALIYHYTDRAGLEGILRGGKLWLTDVFQLNDTSELRHGLRIFDERFAERLSGARPEVEAFYKSQVHFWQSGVPASAHYFVGSLSTLGDDLTQWRSYADDARGYVLSFDAACMEQEFAHPRAGGRWNMATFPVSYGREAAREVIEPLLDLVIPFISYPRQRKMNSAEVNGYMKGLEIHFSLQALHRTLFFKSESYQSEREYRLLEIHRADLAPPDVKIRRRNGEASRYRELNWRQLTPNALKSITIGPASRDSLTAATAVHEALAAAGLVDVSVGVSALPYRSFKAN